jgi:starvation-inducible DNA-binding protein
MKTYTLNEKQKKKLSYSLNILVASQSVLTQKLRSFHWEVEGSHFLEYHPFFEELYNFFVETTDTIAERIRFYSQIPFRTLSEHIKESVIFENTISLDDKKMIIVLIEDFQTLLDAYYTSLELMGSNDLVSEDMLIGIVGEIEKKLWFLRSLNKK